MNVRLHLAAAVASFALLATVPANATELRELRSHVIVDVPDGWSTMVEGDYATAHPKDQTFHLRIKGTEHSYEGEQKAEDHALTFLRNHFDNITVDRHGKRVDWGNFYGVEVFGHGTEKNAEGTPGKFFLLLLIDKKDGKRGCVAVGTGTIAGFDKHHRGIYEALHTLRTY